MAVIPNPGGFNEFTVEHARDTMVINRAVQAASRGVPALQAMQNSSTPVPATNGGFDDDGIFVGYWLAGMPVGSLPVAP